MSNFDTGIRRALARFLLQQGIIFVLFLWAIYLYRAFFPRHELVGHARLVRPPK